MADFENIVKQQEEWEQSPDFLSQRVVFLQQGS